MHAIAAYQIAPTIPCVSLFTCLSCVFIYFFKRAYLCCVIEDTTFIFQKIINHIVARLWFYSFSQKTPYIFRHPTMQPLIDIFSWRHSHFIPFHSISHLFFCSHPVFFCFVFCSPFSSFHPFGVLYACACISTRVFLTITLLILFYIFLLDSFLLYY